jgi:hypothetical protein
MRFLTCSALVALLGLASPAGAAGIPPEEVAKLLAGRDIYYDADGLIVHRADGGPPDGGDTAQREGWYWLGVWIRGHELHDPWPAPRALTFPQVLALLEPGKDGVFYRHPKLPPWNNPRSKEFGFSRDQMIPLVAAMGVWGMKAEIKRLWEALPEDLLGKHSFNGNYRNFLGQDGWDCSEIKKHGCDATANCSLKTDDRDCSLKTDTRDCSLKADDRDCSLQVDTRDCSLQVDTRDCSLQHDTRSCGHDITVCVPFTNVCHTEHVNDPICEAAKAAQNVAYEAARDACEVGKAGQNVAYKAAHDECEAQKAGQNAAYKVAHDSCEAEKAGQNLAYKAEHDSCEAGKASQNFAYKTEHDACEAGKAGQNISYKIEHDLCEIAKSGGKAACEVQKAVDQALCEMTNVHSGDLIGPATVNLFRRALDENPILPVSGELRLPPVNIGSGPLGEAELAVNAGLRIAAGQKSRDDTGDDLNLIVQMLMAKLRFPTAVSNAATSFYAANRPLSYGSYLGAYYAHYGEDATEMASRMEAGIAAGWAPDATGPFGAVRWYHRPATGANPQLAELYDPIIAAFIK